MLPKTCPYNHQKSSQTQRLIIILIIAEYTYIKKIFEGLQTTYTTVINSVRIKVL